MKFLKKSLGQNFLKDLNIIKKITNIVPIINKDVLEIGPGQGALTNQILKNNPKSLTLIEKDDFLYKNLKLRFNNNKKIRIYNQDILKFNLEEKIIKNTIIFGNLPYNISSQILVKLIRFNKWPPKYSALILMFQKEMADRIIGKFNTSKYGRLSILTNYRLKISNKFNVSSNCFFPKPKITSTVLYFKPNLNINYKIGNIKNLEKITNILFSNKRKMINKNIKKIFKSNNDLSLLQNINLKLRPTDLKPEMYYRFTELFEKGL